MGALENNSKITRYAKYLIAICFWVVIWFWAASVIDNNIIMVTPAETVEAIWAKIMTIDFWAVLGHSFVRIVGSSVTASLCGVVLGLIAARFGWVEILFSPVIQVMKSAPIACVAIILLVVMGSNGAVCAIVAFVSLPPFYVASLSAIQCAQKDKSTVLKLMGVSAAQVFLASIWPSMLPLYETAAKTSIGLSWRAGIMGELLGIPLGSIGVSIYASKLILDTAGLLAWTIVIMLVAWLCEKLFVQLLGLTAASPKLALRLRACAFARSRMRLGVRTNGLCDASKERVCIRAENVSKAYSSEVVLDAFSISICSGEKVCLMAPTGSGKTTFLRIVLGMSAPDSGVVSSADICAAVMQQCTLVPTLSALDNIYLCASSSHSRSEIQKSAELLLPKDASSKRAKELSGGTKRLTEILRAMFSPGTCVVLDEPFAGLDAASKQKACGFILDNLADRPLIIATHDKADAAMLGARIVQLTKEELSI